MLYYSQKYKGYIIISLTKYFIYKLINFPGIHNSVLKQQELTKFDAVWMEIFFCKTLSPFLNEW